MSSATPRTILLGGNPIVDEAPASNGPITPGMVLARTSTGTVRPHNTAGADGALFAAEVDYIGTNIDDQYDNGETVTVLKCRKGDRIYALLEQNNDVTIGMPLESNGAGALQPVAAGVAIARSLETIDNTPGTGSVRVKVEIL